MENKIFIKELISILTQQKDELNEYIEKTNERGFTEDALASIEEAINNLNESIL